MSQDITSRVTLDSRQSREVDRIAIEVYGIPGLLLMENAGRGVADLLVEMGIAGPIVICCGKGNNGGDGFVIARHLDGWGVAVRVLLWARPQDLTGDAAENYRMLQRCGIAITVFGDQADPDRLATQLNGAAWIVDALLGTGARGEPRRPLDSVIDQLNRHPAPKLAIDIPSGLDCDSGQPSVHTIRAAHTCTFVTAKPGFLAPQSQPYIGQVHVLPIGTPLRLLSDLETQPPK